jgi:hypothetical protein
MHRPAKLICGIIVSSSKIEEKAIRSLKEEFGDIEIKSKAIPFNFTDYYEKEMGENLKREWVSFKKNIEEGWLKDIKLITIEIEKKLSIEDKRQVNIDPGYVNLSRLVLATTKDYSHRIWLGDGIFAEVTLIYKNHHFHPLEWTYPDYRENREFFERVRRELMKYEL